MLYNYDHAAYNKAGVLFRFTCTVAEIKVLY